MPFSNKKSYVPKNVLNLSQILNMLKEFQDYFASCDREEQDRIIDQL